MDPFSQHTRMKAPDGGARRTQSLIERLSALPLFRGTDQGLLGRLQATSREIGAGEYVFRHGDPAIDLFILLGAKGELPVDPFVQIELAAEHGARPLRLERIVAGELFGELELLSQGLTAKTAKRTSSAFALTPALVVALPVKHLLRLLDEAPALRERITRTGSQRMLSALRQRHEQSQVHPDLQLADWLVEMSVDCGTVEGNRVRFSRRMPQSDIAADLVVTRETISRRLNEWERAGLLRTGERSQHIEIVDYQRVSRLNSLRSSRSREALQRTIEDIDDAIAAGDITRARNIGLDVLRFYPSSPELHHRIALAAARGGDVRGALNQLTHSGLPLRGPVSELDATIAKARTNPFLAMERIVTETWVDDGYGGEDDFDGDEAAGQTASQWHRQLVEDLAALHARLLKEESFAASNKETRNERAVASFNAYHALYQHAEGYYPGINAATMSLVAGDAKRAKKIAANVEATLDAEATDYWSLATLAEAHLIQGRMREAHDALSRASDAEDADAGAKASTILQLQRLARVLSFDIDALVSVLRPSTVAVISGHMFRGHKMDASQQENAEAMIREKALKLLAERRVGYAYGALACGTDIILAEACLSQGIEFNAVLPFDTQNFIETSVEIGDPPGRKGTWEARFRALLEDAQLHSLTIASPGEPLERDLDGHFLYAFRYAAGAALQRADTLQTSCRLIAVSDGREPLSLAG
ncbi:MAG: Crp/Fnr family transcriptional regulator, partial [Pseudomonadota bacterium]